ncbi:MAG: hypothetical protein HXX80_05585 [Nitrososphaerales archaeon]|nr:hypothetical protein [Nitrososphaerales archaeon]
MMFEDIVIIIVASITLLLSIVVLIHYLSKIRRITKEWMEASEIVKGIILEISNRLSQQDQRITDQQVRLDVIELRLEPLSKVLGKEGKEGVRVQEVSDTKQILEEVKDMLRNLEKGRVEISRVAKKREVKVFELLGELSPTEYLVVGLLKEGALTARQIQEKINKSREHTARLMKKLFEFGYVFRNENKMPYIYEITEKGRELTKKISQIP